VDVEVIRSPDASLSKEAERVVKMMPRWKPAKQGNKTVRSRFRLPIMFKIQ
jgi:protein TonB